MKNSTEALEWAYSQGKYTSISEQAILVYLATHSFYREKNNEDAPTGQVLRGCSTFRAISGATAIKSRGTFTAALAGLQEKGFIYRRDRVGGTLYEAPEIHMMWNEDHEIWREDMRNGASNTPFEALRFRTISRTPSTHSPVLRLVAPHGP